MHKRKKILAISYLFPNSQQPNHGIFVLNRLKAMSKYAEVTVINPIPWNPLHLFFKKYKHFRAIPSIDNIGGLTVYHPRFFSIPAVFKSLERFSYYRAIRLVSEQAGGKHAFDVIDLHWTFPDLPAAVKLAKTWLKPIILTLRGMEAFYLKETGSRKDIIAKSMTKVSAIISLSDEMLRHAKTYVERDVLSKIVINGVDRDVFGFIEKESARRQLGLDIQRPIVLSVGSVIKRKGFDVLIEAMMLLKSQNAQDEFPILYILGAEGPEGDYRKELQSKVALLGLDDYVIFFGSVDNSNLKLWYNAADVYCLASRGEGSPNVLTEALACGLPSVATDVGAVNDIARLTGANVRVVPKEDPSEMATMLSEQLNTASDRHENSRTFLQHDWDWCARSVMDILDNLG